jgi:hypothetical protein
MRFAKQQNNNLLSTASLLQQKILPARFPGEKNLSLIPDQLSKRGTSCLEQRRPRLLSKSLTVPVKSRTRQSILPLVRLFSDWTLRSEKGFYP